MPRPHKHAGAPGIPPRPAGAGLVLPPSTSTHRTEYPGTAGTRTEPPAASPCRCGILTYGGVSHASSASDTPDRIVPAGAGTRAYVPGSTTISGDPTNLTTTPFMWSKSSRPPSALPLHHNTSWYVLASMLWREPCSPASESLSYDIVSEPACTPARYMVTASGGTRQHDILPAGHHSAAGSPDMVYAVPFGIHLIWNVS